MTTSERYGALALMFAALALLAWLLLTSCTVNTAAQAYRDCFGIDGGAAICLLDDDAPHSAVYSLAVGLHTWHEVYLREWSEEEMRRVFEITSVHYGRFNDLDGLPCRPEWAGCQDINGMRWPELWVNREWDHDPQGSGTRDGNEWTSALQHEAVHGAESWIEWRDDHEHDDVPRRWGMLASAAAREWYKRLHP